ncbi:MAG: alpha/beta hydrolase [Deltaproteobacteria bacterium]|nr:MAG: alpha/beta hydrolase [Deltaproteobacteria bacterium]TMA70364.1 MAG: alpha/beta hydrolase [Deltaproteobacteria bacterium]
MPPEVIQDDVEYARPGGQPLLARIYRPQAAQAEPWPLLVDVHGGAWTYFNREVDWYFDSALAADGMVVVALDFRLAPTRYPAAVADVVAGIRWAKAHAPALGARADDAGLIGGSSGGHLLMLAALCPSAPEFSTTPVAGAEGVDARVAYAMPLWPILDPLARYRYLLERRRDPTPPRDALFMPERLIESHEMFFGDEATMARASALRVVEAGEAEGLPPIWIAHPELDENVTLPMTERFVAAYRRAGGEAELEVFPGVGHSFANFPGEAADRCIARMRSFIRRRLKSSRSTVR